MNKSLSLPHTDILRASATYYLLAFFCALIMGGLTATGQPVLSVLFAGSLGAVFLAAQPKALLWTVMFMTLVLAGLTLYAVPGMDRIWWASYGMGIMLFVPALIARVTDAQLFAGRTFSPILLAALVFLFIVMVSIAVNHIALWQVVLAAKSMFFFAGVWAALAVLPLGKESVRRWLFGFLLIGLFQWLPAIYQYVFVRPARIAKGQGTVEASDSVVGTFGGSMDSGGLSAVLAAFLIMLLVGLLCLYRRQLLEKRRLLLAIPLLMLPLLLMEVKVIVVYLPLALFVVYKDLLVRRPLLFLGGAAGVAVLMLGIVLAYQSLHWSSDGQDFSHNLETMSSYTFEKHLGDDAQKEGVMTRRQVVDFWWHEHSLSEPVKLLLGHGLGASRTQGLSVGPVAAHYAPRQIDLTGVAMLLWDTGLLGALAFIGLIVSAFRMAGKLAASRKLQAWENALAHTLQAVSLMFLLSFFYRADIPYAAPMMFLFMTMLGLLAWLRNQETLNPQPM